MNRRKFFGTLIGGVAAGAAVRTWPFRVFSFPSEVEVNPYPALTPEMLRRTVELMRSFTSELQFEKQLTETYYTYGIAYWNGHPQPNWNNLNRSLVCTKVDQRRKEITFSCTKSA